MVAAETSVRRVPVPVELIVVAVRWYLRFNLSYRDVQELLVERGVEVDHVIVFRWVHRFTPLPADGGRFCRHSPGDRWFVDETYVKVNGAWRYVYRAVRRVAGVRGITNLITVRPWQISSAAELKHKIEEALRRNCETDADAITVTIDGRTATLTGTVRGWCEKNAAEQAAWLVPGFTAVDNKINVEVREKKRPEAPNFV